MRNMLFLSSSLVPSLRTRFKIAKWEPFTHFPSHKQSSGSVRTENANKIYKYTVFYIVKA